MDNSLPKPHWAKTNYAEGLVDYIKVRLHMESSTELSAFPRGLCRLVHLVPSQSETEGPCMSVCQAAMPEQLSRVREVVQRRDPKGIFRNRWLSTVFDLPHRD